MTIIWDKRDCVGYWQAKRQSELRRAERRAAVRYYGSAALAGILIGAFICWRWL